MIPVQLSLKNKKVLIVGGGNVALRKAKLFLRETSHVSVLAPSIKEELIECGCQGIHKCYESSDIIGYFLVYACSDDKGLNQRIVSDCNDMNILCGSATYDHDVSFYSMGFINNDIGTIALSMNQSLPYHRPLLEDMNRVLDHNRDRIELLYELRSFVLNNTCDKRRYFELLFKCPVKILEFLVTLGNHKGYIYVYHEHDNNENIDVLRKYSIILTVSEFNEYKEIFECLDVVVVPLVLTDGYIYNKIKKILPDKRIIEPVLKNKEDIEYLVSLYECDKNMVYIVHPSYNSYIKDTLNTIIRDKDIVLDFNDQIELYKDKQYRCVVLLMTHGTHYNDYLDLFANKVKEGYNIEYMDTLLENKEFMLYIENKIDKEG